MILPDDKANAKLADLSATTAQQVPNENPPPSYSDIPINEIASSGSTRIQPILAPDMKPSNFIALSRPDSEVKGTWLIDPALHIPATFLGPLDAGESEETRKNISLSSHNGSITADIFIVPTNNNTQIKKSVAKKVFIHTSSHNGSITTRIHETATKDNTEGRLPLNISSQSVNGAISIYIPRTFQGPIRVKTTNGSLKFSDSVQPLLTQFSDVDGVQRSFLGKFEPLKWQTSTEWEGDELFVDTRNGSIKISYVDEVYAAGKSKAGFLGKIFGFE